MQFARLIYSFYHLSIDHKMALINYCVEKYSHSVSILKVPLEYSDQVLERARGNRNLVSKLELFAESNESILIHLFSDKIYDFVIDGSRPAAEADHILHASRILDLMKQPTGIKVRKDVTGE
jgi:hypothetical protein